MAGVYISYPFCSQKCTYCNFSSGVEPASAEEQYVEALRAEINGHEWRWRPETIYFGGGTPSRLSPDSLDAVLSLVPGSPWREVTLEVSPGDVNRELAERWARAGVNRVSLGVQSFVPSEASAVGRRHTPQIVERDVQLLREAGIPEANVDLIAGLPGQTETSWQESLDWVERFGVSHVSVYMLEVDEESRLGRELIAGGARYGARAVPDEDTIVRLYEAAVSRLESLGILRYEISNFARPGHESLHNLKYWRLEPYVGFGADAHSFDGCQRRANVETPAEYIDCWRRGGPPEREVVAANLTEERLLVGLRLRDGVFLPAAEWKKLGGTLQPFLENGLVEREDDRLRLTPRGILLSNEVFQGVLDG